MPVFMRDGHSMVLTGLILAAKPRERNIDFLTGFYGPAITTADAVRGRH
jgi:hypothetical protein